MKQSIKTKFITLIIALAAIIAVLGASITFGGNVKGENGSNSTGAMFTSDEGSVNITDENGLKSFLASDKTLGIITENFTVSKGLGKLPKDKMITGGVSGNTYTVTVASTSDPQVISQENVDGTDVHPNAIVGKRVSGGLFSSVEGMISDLKVVIKSSFNVSGNADFVGGISGYNSPEASFLNVSLTVNSFTSYPQSTFIGGMVGANFGSLNNSVIDFNDLDLNNQINFGGIAGDNSGIITNSKVNFKRLKVANAKFGGVASQNELDGKIYYTTFSGTAKQEFTTTAAQCVGHNIGIINGIYIDGQNTLANYKIVGTNQTAALVRNVYITTISTDLITDGQLGANGLFAKQIVTDSTEVSFEFINNTASDTDASYRLNVELTDNQKNSGKTLYGARALWYSVDGSTASSTQYEDRTDSEKEKDNKYNVNPDGISNIFMPSGLEGRANFTKTIENDAHNTFYKYQIMTAKVESLAQATNLSGVHAYSSDIMSKFTNELTLSNADSQNPTQLNKEDLLLYGTFNGGITRLMNIPGDYTNITVSNGGKYANVLDCTSFEKIYNNKNVGANFDVQMFVLKKDFNTSGGTLTINPIRLREDQTMETFEQEFSYNIINSKTLAPLVHKYKIATNGPGVTIISKDEGKYRSLFTDSVVKFDTKILGIESTDINGITYYVTALNADGDEISNTATYKLKIDREKPSLELISELNEDVWYKNSQNVEFTVSDRQSLIGDITVRYCFTDSRFTNPENIQNDEWDEILYPKGDVFTFSVEEGKNYYYVKVEDKAGNFEIYEYQLSLDSKIPTFELRLDGGLPMTDEIAVNDKLRIQFAPNDMIPERLADGSYIKFTSGGMESIISVTADKLEEINDYMFFTFLLPFAGNVDYEVKIVTRSGNVSDKSGRLNVTKSEVRIYADSLNIPSKLTKRYDGNNVFEIYDGENYLNDTGVTWSQTFLDDYPNGLKFKITFPDAKKINVKQQLNFEVDDDRYNVIIEEYEAIQEKLNNAEITSLNIKLELSGSGNFTYVYNGQKISIDSDAFKYRFKDIENPTIYYDDLIPELASAISVVLERPEIINAGEKSPLNFAIDMNKLKETIAYDSGTFFIEIYGVEMDTAAPIAFVSSDKEIQITKKILDVSIDFSSIKLVYTGENQLLKLNDNTLTQAELDTIKIQYEYLGAEVDSILKAGKYKVSLFSVDPNYNIPSYSDEEIAVTEFSLEQKQIQANVNKVSDNTSYSAIELEYTGNTAALEIDFGVSDAILDADFLNGNGISILLGNKAVAYEKVGERKYKLIFDADGAPVEIAQYSLFINITGTNNVKGLEKEIIFKIVKTTHNSLDLDFKFVYNGEEHTLGVAGYPSVIDHVCYFSKQDWDGNAVHVCNCEFEETFGEEVSVNTNKNILFVIVDWAGADNSTVKPPYKHTAAGEYQYKISFYNHYFASSENLSRSFDIASVLATDLYSEVTDIMDAQYEYQQKPKFQLSAPSALKQKEGLSELEIAAVYYFKPIGNEKDEKVFFDTKVSKMIKHAEQEETFTNANPATIFDQPNDVAFTKKFTNAGIYVYRYMANGESLKGENDIYFTKVMRVNRAVLDKSELSVDPLQKVFDGKMLNMEDIKGKTYWGKYSVDNDEAFVTPSFLTAGEEIVDADPENPYDVVYTFSSLNYDDITVTQAFTVLPKPVKVKVKSMKNEIRITSDMKKLQELLEFEAKFSDPTQVPDEDGVIEEVEVSLNFDEVNTSVPGVYKVTIQLDNENYVAINEAMEITLLKQISLISIIIGVVCAVAVLLLALLLYKLYMKRYQIKL